MKSRFLFQNYQFSVQSAGASYYIAQFYIDNPANTELQLQSIGLSWNTTSAILEQSGSFIVNSVDFFNSLSGSLTDNGGTTSIVTPANNSDIIIPRLSAGSYFLDDIGLTVNGSRMYFTFECKLSTTPGVGTSNNSFYLNLKYRQNK